MPDPRVINAKFDDVMAIAIDDASELEDALLGKVCWFQISGDLRVKPERLTEYFAYFGIPDQFLPKSIDPRAVAKGVLTKHPKAPGRDKLWLIGDHKWELKFWVEEKADGAIEAPLVRRRRRTGEERKRGAGEWEAVTVATAVWDPKHEPLSEAFGFAIAEGHEQEYPYQEIFSALDEDYNDQLAHFTGAAIQSSIRKMLDKTDGLPMRQTGGVWVIHKDSVDLFDRVEKLVDALIAPPLGDDGNPIDGYEDDGNTIFVCLDLIDGAKQRLIIRGAVETRVLHDLARSITHLNNLRRTGLPARPSELAEATAIRRKALEIGKHYASVVEGEIKSVRAMLNDFDVLYSAAMTGAAAETIAPESLRRIESLEESEESEGDDGDDSFEDEPDEEV
jgi:hypothetical protein